MVTDLQCESSEKEENRGAEVSSEPSDIIKPEQLNNVFQRR